MSIVSIWGMTELIDANQPQWEWRFALLLLHLGKHSQKSNSQKEGSLVLRGIRRVPATPKAPEFSDAPLFLNTRGTIL